VATDTSAHDLAARRSEEAPEGPFATALHVEELRALGALAFTTTRAAGSFGLASAEPVEQVMGRWSALMDDCRALGRPALASAGQVHGADVQCHEGGWRGWLRGRDRDGHATRAAGVALAVTIADCTPVFLVHEDGASALLHAGWRGTAAGVLERGLAAMQSLGARPEEVHVHLGPAICGRCYEVGPEVVEAVTGQRVDGPTLLDVRANLAERAERAGCRAISVSRWCTKCDGDRLYSHRAGDAGRQLAVLMGPAGVVQIM
jgi:YfiH family protein